MNHFDFLLNTRDDSYREARATHRALKRSKGRMRRKKAMRATLKARHKPHLKNRTVPPKRLSAQSKLLHYKLGDPNSEKDRRNHAGYCAAGGFVMAACAAMLIFGLSPGDEGLDTVKVTVTTLCLAPIFSLLTYFLWSSRDSKSNRRRRCEDD